MISLDQVLLLQKKVETAVERMGALNAENSQLKSENDALRSKCAELTKALAEKTELVSHLEADQSKIEEGILLALDRLDTVENSVLSAASTSVKQNTEVTTSESDESKTVSETAVTEAATESTPFSKDESEPVSSEETESTPVNTEETQSFNEQTPETQSEPVTNFEQEALFSSQPETFSSTAAPQSAIEPPQVSQEQTINNEFDIF